MVLNLTRFARDCPGQVRPLCTALAPEVPRHLVAIGDRANRRHINRQVDEKRAGRLCAIRQRRSFGQNARRGCRKRPRAMRQSLMTDPERAPIVRRLFKHYATGTYTKQEILQKATQWGLTNRRGQPLSSQAIGMLLRNRLYVGIIDVPESGVRDQRGDFDPS